MALRPLALPFSQPTTASIAFPLLSLDHTMSYREANLGPRSHTRVLLLDLVLGSVCVCVCVCVSECVCMCECVMFFIEAVQPAHPIEA